MRSILRLCLFLLVVSIVLPQKISAATVTVCDEASLRAAITNGGTINFGCDGAIVLSSTLQITTNTVLDGTGRNVVLSGGDAVRVLFVATNIDLTINNLTIANGKLVGTNGVNMSNGERTPGESVFGAGIYNNGGSILLSGCSLLNNAAIGGNGGNGDSVSKALGAAIYNDGGFLTITNTVIAGNSCLGGSGGGFSLQFGDTGANALGGALYSKNGTVVITASEVRSNNVTGGIASSDGISYRGGSSSGGALFIENGPISINQTRFSDNRANGGARTPNLGNTSYPSGSAQGGAAYFTNSTATISLCKFLTNSSAAGVDGGIKSVSGITQGGAIFNAGTLNITDTLLAGNSSRGGDAAHGGGESDGGALCNIASLIVNRSTIVSNEARAGAGSPRSEIQPGGPGRGGGIYSVGNFSGTNVTIVLNQAAGAEGSTSSFGGNPSNGEGGGLFNLGPMSLVHSTVASNAVQPGAGDSFFVGPPGLALGAEVYSTNGPAIVQNSIIGSSLSGSNCFGVLIDNGNNLSSDATCKFTAPGSLNNTNPLLSPLDDFGGPTPTMALLAGSPAIDHGLAIYCPATDQRGITRPFAGACDIGAFELKTYQFNALTVESYTNQILHLIFTGTNGQSCQVQTTTNLFDWTSIVTNQVGTNGIFDFFYTNDLAEPFRSFQTYTP